VALDDLEALVKETCGVLEKLAVRNAMLSRSFTCSPPHHAHHRARYSQEGNLKLGSWQMVLWQPRFVRAEVSALCYQKITADEVCSSCLRSRAYLPGCTQHPHVAACTGRMGMGMTACDDDSRMPAAPNRTGEAHTL
jgi:hypothetical protein